MYRKEASETEFTRLLDSLAATGADDMSVAPGMTYTYYVTPYDASKDVEGTPSEQVTVEIPAEELTPVIPVTPGDGERRVLAPRLRAMVERRQVR